MKSANRALILAIIVFTILSFLTITAVPFLDGNIDFVKSCDFYTGGFTKLLSSWWSVHPPAKEILTAVFFWAGGLNRISYGIIGPIFGLGGIITFYLLLKLNFNKTVASLATVLLALSPLFLAAGVFALTDFLLTVFLICSLYFYAKQRFFLFFICASIAMLTKETGIILSISLLLTELVFFNKKNLKKILISIAPFWGIALWYIFLKINGHGFWSDWNFRKVPIRPKSVSVYF